MIDDIFDTDPSAVADWAIADAEKRKKERERARWKRKWEQRLIELGEFVMLADGERMDAALLVGILMRAEGLTEEQKSVLMRDGHKAIKQSNVILRHKRREMKRMDRMIDQILKTPREF